MKCQRIKPTIKLPNSISSVQWYWCANITPLMTWFLCVRACINTNCVLNRTSPVAHYVLHLVPSPLAWLKCYTWPEQHWEYVIFPIQHMPLFYHNQNAWGQMNIQNAIRKLQLIVRRIIKCRLEWIFSSNHRGHNKADRKKLSWGVPVCLVK